MLNEIQEVFDYTFDLDNTDPKPWRIKRSICLHANDLNGIERMLTMISRAFIFDEDVADRVQGRRRAEAAMRMWLGYTEDLKENERLEKEYLYLKENYPELDHWLAAYLRDDASSDTPERMEKVEKALEKIAGKKSQYESRSLSRASRSNDYKKLTFDKVLSNAQGPYGPLKKYYLVGTKEKWTEGIFKRTEQNTNGKIGKGDKDKILKVIAAYLLERNRKEKGNDDYVFEQVNLSAVALWATGSTKLDSSKFAVYSFEGKEDRERRPLINFYSSKSNNYTKAKPDEEWFESCGWEIIDATENADKLNEYLKEHPGAIFFSDQGGNKELALNKCYPGQKLAEDTAKQ